MNFWTGFYKQAEAGIKEVGFTAVINGDGKMLMGKRRDNESWTHPGGHLEEGEDGLTGAVRELFEEAGIEADPKKMKHLVTKTVTKPGGGKIKVHAYRYDVKDIPSTSMKQDPDGEVYRWHWVNFDGGLKKEIEDNLHVPLKDNLLLQALGIEKSAAPDKLRGGQADHMSDDAFNAAELLKGVKHEMEHTGDRSMAEEIAKDHLVEDPKYYKKLEKMEKGASLLERMEWDPAHLKRLQEAGRRNFAMLFNYERA